MHYILFDICIRFPTNCHLFLSAFQCDFLRQQFHIYLMRNGRINVCGITATNVDYVASAIRDAVEARRLPQQIVSIIPELTNILYRNLSSLVENILHKQQIDAILIILYLLKWNAFPGYSVQWNSKQNLLRGVRVPFELLVFGWLVLLCDCINLLRQEQFYTLRSEVDQQLQQPSRASFSRSMSFFFC